LAVLAKRLVKVPLVAKKLVEVAEVVVEVVTERLVCVAVVLKKEVEVELVVVEFTPVKFCRVEEAVTKRLAIEAKEMFGSKKNLAEEVEVPPMATMSVLLSGALMN